MKTPRIGAEEMERRMRSIVGEARAQKQPLGFYIHLMCIAAALVAIAATGSWRILYAIFLMPLGIALTAMKEFYWWWTEKRLRIDAEAGRLERALWWDYLCLFLDLLVQFALFALSTYAVFALAGDATTMPLPLIWICVLAFHAPPNCYAADSQGYGPDAFMFWDQWVLIATAVASSFYPIYATGGLLLQVAVCMAMFPRFCKSRKPGYVNTIKGYQSYAAAGRGLDSDNPMPYSMREADFLVLTFLKSMRLRWLPFSVTLTALAGGLVWLIAHGVFLSIAAAALAVVLGYFYVGLINCPGAMEEEEIRRRGIDIDLLPAQLDLRAGYTLFALATAGATIIWLGGHDPARLAALALLAVGSCNPPLLYVRLPDEQIKVDALHIPVQALAFSVVVAMRLSGFCWWACLLPLPALAYVYPLARFFFPRSGLRGAERKAALADMAQRLKADIRSAAEKARDERAEKRRRRDARRLANFRRSRGEG